MSCRKEGEGLDRAVTESVELERQWQDIMDKAQNTLDNRPNNIPNTVE